MKFVYESLIIVKKDIIELFYKILVYILYV